MKQTKLSFLILSFLLLFPLFLSAEILLKADIMGNWYQQGIATFQFFDDGSVMFYDDPSMMGTWGIDYRDGKNILILWLEYQNAYLVSFAEIDANRLSITKIAELSHTDISFSADSNKLLLTKSP